MYDIRFDDARSGDGTYLVIENNRIYFEHKEDAYKFLIELLTETGRIGY